MTVAFAPAASRALIEVWDYTAERRGIAQADRYDAFLKAQLAGLGDDPERGHPIGVNPDYRYLVMKTRPKADGHVAAYRIDHAAQTVQIVRIYHTKQDWQAYLAREG